MSHLLEIELVSRDDGLNVVVSGELDIGTVPDLVVALRRAEASDAAMIAVDMSHVTFVDSTGIHALIAADLRSRRNGNRLRFTAGPEQLRRLLRLTGADRRLAFLAER